MNPRVYSVAEVADLLAFPAGRSGVAGEMRVRRLITAGQLRAVRIGRAVRIPCTEIDRLLTEGLVAS
jgi:excisionase family DNA binding protein